MIDARRTRRTFLKEAGTASAGLYLAFHLPACSSARKWGKPEDLEANAALRITPEGAVIFTLARVEMGQGTMTGETTMVAEELNLDPEEIEIQFAPAHADFNNPEWDVQLTGGSTSTRTSFPHLCKAGAVAREALISAAAAKWGVPRSEIQLEGKVVEHTKSDKKAGIGELVAEAKKHIDLEAEPKPRSEWRYIGKARPRLDAKAKSDGSAKFGTDEDPPDMEVAVIVRGPLGARPTKIESEKILKMPGVKAVLEVPTGVALVADRYHRAMKARRMLNVEWSKGTFNTDEMWKRYAATLDGGETGSTRARSDGDAAGTLANAKNVVEAEYRLPFVAHATMEPQNCTAHVQANRVDIWAPTQGPGRCVIAAQDITGLSRDKIFVHQTLLGGGFGRRGEGDFVEEAVHLSKVRKKPVRVMWSREDDTQHDFYRPASLHRLKGAVDGERPVAWAHHVVQQTMMKRLVPDMLREPMPAPIAKAATWGLLTFTNDAGIIEGADHIPYGIENVSVRYHTAPYEVPVGFWRSVGHSSNAFVVESFIDELAHAAGQDPVDFRRKLLTGHARHLGVLELAAKESGWGTPLPEGHARGVAVHKSFESYVAEVAEVSVEDGKIRVHRVVAATDVGQPINPDIVRAQVESGIVYGLSAALTQEEITYKEGRVQQSNFHDFEVLRMADCPKIEVHLVESTERPSGIGEPGTPPIAAAVGNAVYALTKKRLRSLPFRLA